MTEEGQKIMEEEGYSLIYPEGYLEAQAAKEEEHHGLLKYNPEGEEEYANVYFHSRNRRMLSMDEFEENYEEAMDTINMKLGNYMAESSGRIVFLT